MPEVKLPVAEARVALKGRQEKKKEQPLKEKKEN